MFVYDKLFTLLESQGKNKAWLRNNGLNARTVDKLIHNQNVTTKTLNHLCNLLDCKPEDIFTYIPDKM